MSCFDKIEWVIMQNTENTPEKSVALKARSALRHQRRFPSAGFKRVKTPRDL